MATLLSRISFFLSLFLIQTFLITATDSIFSDQFVETKAKSREGKLTHLHFYFHDVVSGKNPTAVTVAGRKNAFGGTAMVDDPLTEGPKPSSKVVGRAQGMYAMASQKDTALLMVMNFAFLEGGFNGSSLSILGRNRVLDPVREMPIVGGSGLFRFARGYALARTIRYNLKTGDAVVEYNVFVLHG